MAKMLAVYFAAMIAMLFPEAKIVCCVRDVFRIIDSFERILRRNPLQYNSMFNFKNEPSIYGRVQMMMNARDGVIGGPHSALRSAWFTELASKLILVRYDSLTRQPEKTLAELYRLLGEAPFAHDIASVEGDEARVTYVLDRSRLPGADHFYDGGVASTFNIVRDLCGPEWSAKVVTLPRRAPAHRKPYDEVFKTKIAFGSETASVIFAQRWLRRRLPTANPSLRAFLQRLVRRAAQRRGSDADEIRRIIRLQLMGGRPGMDGAAAMIGATRRTLARRLAAEGATFRALVQDVRFEMADELIRETDASMGRIAELLGYSDQTAFSRAFSNRFGHPPSRARGAET